jgi:deoxyadenosine/deoxycytidine kinase
VDGYKRLLNQIFESLQAETVDIDLAFAIDDLLRQRLADRRRVFESMA